MAEHKHGSMDIRVQQNTYNGFLKAAKFTVIAAIVVLVFMALANA